MTVMKTLLLVGLMAVTLAGCSRGASGKAKRSAAPKAARTQPIVTPAAPFTGRVLSANLPARFVVVHFPSGQIPAINQTLSLYRGGLKVGEVKVTGPQMNQNTVADITAGDARKDDDVRPE